MAQIIQRIRDAVGLTPDPSGADGEAEEDTSPCNVSGHDWSDIRTHGYYTSGVPHFGPGDSWEIEKKMHKECTKCGRAQFDKTTIGKVAVDKDTDELVIVSNQHDDQ